MLALSATLGALLLLGLAPRPARAASPHDLSTTHKYLLAGYAALHKVVSTWNVVEADIRKLDARFRAECPDVGAGSPQNEAEQRLSYEVAGALWATGYHTDAQVVHAFIKAVGSLSWSAPAITRSARRFDKGLIEMTQLQVPNLCGDVRAWAASGYKTVPPSTEAFDKHVEAVEAKEVSPSLLRRYVAASDRGLLAKVERLYTRFTELEFSRGQIDWDTLLEVLALNE